jgi:hypothetical protein
MEEETALGDWETVGTNREQSKGKRTADAMQKCDSHYYT